MKQTSLPACGREVLRTAQQNGIRPGAPRHRGVPFFYQTVLLRGVNDDPEIIGRAVSLQNGIGKSAEYTMSHPDGKIQILGTLPDGRMFFRFRQAKDPDQNGRIFIRNIGDSDAWIYDRIIL